MKYLIFFFLIFIINCAGNKVSNYHGTKDLGNKYNKIKINITNKNDLLNIIGPPSTKSDFNKNKWFYLERLKTNQSLFKFGTQKITVNNILIVEINNAGILIDKKLLNLNNMNDLKYFKKITTKDIQNNNMLYGVFSSLREKINAPSRQKK
tara:strand:+ start:811 stop:1263 length:453 start_codon:yes stop_codon:yes gene_type:complete